MVDRGGLRIALEVELDAARGGLDTEADFRRALSNLRGASERKVANMLKKALAAYLASNDKQLPTDLGQLQPFFDSRMDDAILQRWEIAPAKTVEGLGMGGDVIITQKGPVDDVFDTRFGIGPNGWGSTDFLNSTTGRVLEPVNKAFLAANNGQWPTDSSQTLTLLLPYATTPEQQAALQKLLLRRAVEK